LALTQSPAVVQAVDEQLQAIGQQRDRLKKQIDSLRVRSPLGATSLGNGASSDRQLSVSGAVSKGVWICPDEDRLRGAYVKQGQAIGLVADPRKLIIRATTDQYLGPRIDPEVGVGGVVEVKVRGRPDQSFVGTIRKVLPAGQEQLPSAALGYLAGGSMAVATDENRRGTRAAEPFFEVWIDPAAQKDSQDMPELFSGQRVIVRFTMPDKPWLAQWWREARQLVQRRFQI
jgi:putative peptide zinc metalloprotease protein